MRLLSMMRPVMHGIVVLMCGLIFLGLAWWTRTHEHPRAVPDRMRWESNASRFNTANYRVSVFLNRFAAPVGLLVLGVVATFGGAVQIVEAIA